MVVPHVASLLWMRPALEPCVLGLLREDEDTAHRRAVHAADEEGDHGGGARHGADDGHGARKRAVEVLAE